MTGPAGAADEEVSLGQLTARVAVAFPQLSEAEVRRCAEQAYRDFAEAPVREFVLVIAERRARAACRELVAGG